MAVLAIAPEWQTRAVRLTVTVNFSLQTLIAF